jgi:hypothetical protein
VAQKAAEAKKKESKNLRILIIILGSVFGGICVISSGVGIGVGVYNMSK